MAEDECVAKRIEVNTDKAGIVDGETLAEFLQAFRVGVLILPSSREQESWAALSTGELRLSYPGRDTGGDINFMW